MSLHDTVSRSIRAKILALVLATTGAALLLSAVGRGGYDLRSFERQWSADMGTQADLLARATGPALLFDDRNEAQKDLGVMRVRPRVLAAGLYTRDGQLFAAYQKPGTEADALPAKPGPAGYMIHGDRFELFRAVVENDEIIGSVYLRSEYDPWARLQDYLAIIGAVMLASLAAAALMFGWLARTVTTPITEVAEVARQLMDRRDYSLRARKTTRDEVGELVDAFNAMVAEIGRRSEALRLADQRKDEFLATLAHELRNPLAPIRNALEILRLSVDDPQRSAKAREMMERQVQQMVRLVDDLLDVSRITTGKLVVRKTVIDLQSAVRDAIEIARPVIESRRHAFEVVLDPESLHIEGDRTRLAQVYSNLLNNAAKYTDPGGRIQIVVRREGRDAVVRVSDNGVGIAPESQQMIFDMFSQVDRSLERSQAGLGVGLTLARRLVELHEGRIEVESAGAGRGSTFTVRIPLTFARVEETVPARAGQGPATAARRVLLADDNVDYATSMGQLLLGRGHDVRIVHDGAAALEEAVRFRPEIAFVDIGMPKVHGYDVAKRMRAEPATASCVLVAITGWGQENDRDKARAAGFDRHLVKPVDPVEIDAILEKY